MNRLINSLAQELQHLIVQLGHEGGLNGPSIYETAQVLRLATPSEGVEQGLDWLVSQQYADGGWGDPSIPIVRDTATIAALLTIHTYRDQLDASAMIERGLAFLRNQAIYWAEGVPNDIPIAAELLIPQLIAEAHAQGLAIPAEHYTQLALKGNTRRRLIAAIPIRPGTPAVHSWEGWGEIPTTNLIDAAGSIGHSASATAAWLHAARTYPELEAARARCTAYLQSAAQATGTHIPGVVPAVHPFARNEQIVSLFALQLADLLDYNVFQAEVRAQIDDVWRSVRADGQGISDYFSCDGDITAMLFAIVHHAGYTPDISILYRYIPDDACLTYQHELQRSLSATAHAAYTIAVMGLNPKPLLDNLCANRSGDGRWTNDKWHASWLYTTAHTIHTLLRAGWVDQALLALPAMLQQQHPDGSWGVTEAIVEETAYGVIALLAYDQLNLLPEQGKQALELAARWLFAHHRPENSGACWIAKGLYRPRRISWVIEASAALACALRGYGIEPES